MAKILDAVCLLMVAFLIGLLIVVTLNHNKPAKNLQGDGEVEIYLTPEGDVRWRREERN